MSTVHSIVAIRCIPRGICSYDFRLEGGGRQGSLRFDWLVEEGWIDVDGGALTVRKHGPFGGHWTLESEGRTRASAQKSNVLTRTFELSDATANLTLKAVSALGRSFRLMDAGQERATMRPDHPFTRRATIQVGQPTEFETLAFAFWLVVLMWRRGDGS